MIFVTVGTHEQPFNRLIQKIDELKKERETRNFKIIENFKKIGIIIDEEKLKKMLLEI